MDPRNKPCSAQMAILLVELQDAGTRIKSFISGTGHRWWAVENGRGDHFATATVEGLHARGALVVEESRAPARPGERPYVTSYVLAPMFGKEASE